MFRCSYKKNFVGCPTAKTLNSWHFFISCRLFSRKRIFPTSLEMPSMWSVPTVTLKYSSCCRDCSSQIGESTVSPWRLRQTRGRKVQAWCLPALDVLGGRGWQHGSAQVPEGQPWSWVGVLCIYSGCPGWVRYPEGDGDRVYAYWMLTDIKNEAEESAFPEL